MEVQDLNAWVEAYVRAWQSNDPADIGRLFAEDALYYTAPHREPWQGRETIVAGWIGRKDEPDTWTFRFEVLAVAGDLGFVRGWTNYDSSPPTAVSNLWVIRLGPNGECREFTEWWQESMAPETDPAVHQQ